MQNDSGVLNPALAEEQSEARVVVGSSPSVVIDLTTRAPAVEPHEEVATAESTTPVRALGEAEIPKYVAAQLDTLPPGSLATPSLGYRVVKRAFDLVVAVPVLIVSLPVIALLALAIRLESPGPAIFRQRRVGRDGEVFTFHKFRTMYVNATEMFPELYDYDFDSSELTERYYKRPNDPRNTRLGALVRRTSLDELPNLFNVVKGDVSIVGPRPELQEMVKHYEAEQLVKFGVKPGLTCLAACTGRNTLTIDEQIRADVEYAHRKSFWLDMWIVGQTIKMIVAMIGAE